MLAGGLRLVNAPTKQFRYGIFREVSRLCFYAIVGVDNYEHCARRTFERERFKRALENI